MIEPVGNVAPIMLAQSLAHDQLAQLGLRMAGALAGELGRSRAELAFARADAPALVAATGLVRPSGALSGAGARHVTLDTHGAVGTDGRARRGACADERRRVSDDPERRRGDGHDDRAAHADGAAVVVSDARVRAIEAGLAHCRELLEAAGIDGEPVGLLLPARPIVGVSPSPGNEADLTLLCLGIDGALGASRHVWGFAFAGDRCAATFVASRASRASIASSPDADVWSFRTTDSRGGRCGIEARVDGARVSGLLLHADEASGRRSRDSELEWPPEWHIGRGEITWH